MVISKIYPNPGNTPLGPLLKRGAIVSVQVETVSGATLTSGGVFQLQSSNSQDSWVNEGSTITGPTTTPTITDFTVNKQAVQVICTTAPSGGVKVTIYADGVHE